MKEKLSRLIAHFVVHRPRTVVAIALAAVGFCAWILASRQNFDTEVLNLLPPRFESVQALKILNNDFAQARELIFALHGEPDAVADYREPFIEALRGAPWAARVFSGPPIESPEELQTLSKLAAPLLLNLESPAFAQTLDRLTPERIREQISRLRQQVEAGSNMAEMQLSTDPLGLIGAALRPVAGSHGMEKGQALGSEDGTLSIIPVFTRQASLSQPDCKALMDDVDRYVAELRSTWDADAPEIFVTGRSAYVAQISAAMEQDIKVTSTVSILAVAGLFFVAFRRVLPLVGIMVTLGMSCFISFALGCLWFDNLNMVAIAFCSILVGLGDDFSLLLYNRYLHDRRTGLPHEEAVASSIAEVGPGILYVAATTGTGFLVLLFSGSAGFAQLGSLVAIGIILCGILMCTVLFVFIRPAKLTPLRGDPFTKPIGRYVDWVLERPQRLTATMIVIFLVTVGTAVSPVARLSFDTSPRSLEPKQTAAARALKLIGDKIGAPSELIAVVVEAENAQQGHERWSALAKHFDGLVQAGILRSYTSPAGLQISPERVKANQDALRKLDLDASKQALRETIEKEGLNQEAFGNVFGLLEQLQLAGSAAEITRDVRTVLPESSSWQFLIDRYFGARPGVTAGYLSPAKALVTAEDQAALEEQIKAAGVPVRITGWGYAMTSLVPWAKRELLVFSTGVGALILILLAVAYRRWIPWAIHAASLVFAIGATIASLKVIGVRINMLNALAFPLVLGVGVDYGLHILFAMREHGDRRDSLVTVLKPLVVCGFTTITGFGSLMLARNPALSGLGLVCALGIAWCLVASVLFVLPLSAWALNKTSPQAFDRA